MLVAARPAFFIAMGAKAFAALTCYPLTRLKVMGTTQRKVCAALAHTITCLEEVQSRHCRQCHARTLGPAFSPGLSRQAVGCPLKGRLWQLGTHFDAHRRRAARPIVHPANMVYPLTT